jgi:hypothetical protein
MEGNLLPGIIELPKILPIVNLSFIQFSGNTSIITLNLRFPKDPKLLTLLRIRQN